MNRLEVSEVAKCIKEGVVSKEVVRIREVYHLMKPERQADGQVNTHFRPEVKLPRVCFSAEYGNRKKVRKLLKYNGLVVLELNGLATYDQATALRNMAAKMPETLMAFLGGSGRSVKILCRGEQFSGGLPKKEDEIRQFHQNLYNTARLAYQNQFQMNIEYLEPLLDRTVYLSADPELYYNAKARAFLADVKKPIPGRQIQTGTAGACQHQRGEQSADAWAHHRQVVPAELALHREQRFGSVLYTS